MLREPLQSSPGAESGTPRSLPPLGSASARLAIPSGSRTLGLGRPGEKVKWKGPTGHGARSTAHVALSLSKAQDFFFKALQPPLPLLPFSLCVLKETYFGVVCAGVAASPSSCEVHSTRDGVPVTLVDSSLSGRG